MLYTITSTLPPKHGGRTKALLSRIALIENELNEYSTIVTTNYNANYPTVYDQFRKDGKAGSQVKFENLYDWLSGYQLFKIPTSRFLNKAIKVTTDRSMPGLKSVEKGEIVRYYD